MGILSLRYVGFIRKRNVKSKNYCDRSVEKCIRRIKKSISQGKIQNDGHKCVKSEYWMFRIRTRAFEIPPFFATRYKSSEPNPNKSFGANFILHGSNGILNSLFMWILRFNVSFTNKTHVPKWQNLKEKLINGPKWMNMQWNIQFRKISQLNDRIKTRIRVLTHTSGWLICQTHSRIIVNEERTAGQFNGVK